MELLRPTVERPAVELAAGTAPPADDQAEADIPADDQAEANGPNGRGVVPPAATRSRRTRRVPAGKMKARNIHLTDDVHDRLWLLARQRKQSVSAVANDMLDKTLPRWEVKRTT